MCNRNEYFDEGYEYGCKETTKFYEAVVQRMEETIHELRDRIQQMEYDLTR